ncbi:ATP-grasp domain-containing protein [Devosia sp. CN2-171]|uniref:ATP-grasp domain-containing protein n=1 Tax=Devosia sp. CN2-171 TaxID=3400909 RepID=UPI003BF8ED93
MLQEAKLEVIVFVSTAPGDALRAARKYGLEIWMVADGTLTWQRDLVDRQVDVSPYDVDAMVPVMQLLLDDTKRVGFITYDERAVVSAAALAHKLEGYSITIQAALASRDKFQMRRALSEAGLRVPSFGLAANVGEAVHVAADLGFPVVLKPRWGMMSQGVVRTDNSEEVVAAFPRTQRVAQSHIPFAGSEAASEILIERFIPGRELAVDGTLSEDGFLLIGIFDKPDIGDGPYFEEVLYITPSAETPETQTLVATEVLSGVKALGLTSGAIHAEVRIQDGVCTIIEIGARPIGGLCGRAHTYCLDVDYHDLVLQSTLGLPAQRRSIGGRTSYAGVLMLPVTERGILAEITGVDQAKAIPNVRDVHVMAKPGDRLLGFPEQDCYLGFVIASAPTHEAVRTALDSAKASIVFEVFD